MRCFLAFGFGFLTVAPPAFAFELELSKAMEMAAAQSPAAKSARSAAHEAELREAQARGSLGPRLELESTQAWMSSDVNKLVGKSLGTQVVPDRVNTVSLTVSQPLVGLAPLYLKAKMEILAARQAGKEAGQTERNARFAGAESFLRAHKSGELLRIAQASLRLAEKQKQDGESLARLGKLKPLDLLRLDLSVAEARTQISQAETVRDVALFALAETIGISDYKSLSLKAPVKEFFLARSAAFDRPEELFSEAARNRTELTGAATRVELADLGQRAAWWELAPSLNAFVKFERDFEKSAISTPPAVSVNPQTRLPSVTPGTTYAAKDIRDNLTFGLNLRWTLWDWNVRWNRQEELGVKREELKAATEQVETATRIETMQAWLELRSARETVSSARTTLKFAEEVNRQQNARFLLGMATVTDVTSASRDETRAQAGLATAETDLELVALKLLKALGKEPI